MRVNKVKQALKEGKLQLGCSVSMIRSPEITRVLAAAGLDWAYLDSEHGGFDLETLQDLARAANENGLCPIIRVAELSLCAGGSRARLRSSGSSVSACRISGGVGAGDFVGAFPPLGVRGFGLQPTHLNYEIKSMPDIIAHMNENVMVVLQIETVTALNRVDELLAVPGVDAVMVGPADLSVSLGVAGQFEHPSMIAAIEKIRDACLRAGVAPGIHMRSLKLAQYWRDTRTEVPELQ